MNKKKTDKLVRALLEAGWESDDCYLPYTARNAQDTGEALESLLHELAHNLVAGGEQELRDPKNSKATAVLIHENPCTDATNADELLVTSVTIKTASYLRLDCRASAVSSSIINMDYLHTDKRFTEAEITAEIKRLLSTKRVSELADILYEDLKRYA